MTISIWLTILYGWLTLVAVIVTLVAGGKIAPVARWLFYIIASTFLVLLTITIIQGVTS
jgi:hypothetical protein